MLLQPFKYNPNFHTGLFKHKIKFFAPTVVVDDLGQAEESYIHFKDAWAMIKTMKGSEYFNAAASRNENTYRFIIHYSPGIEPIMNIEFKGRTFLIESVLNDDEANKTLTIIANEKR